jgi:hypothetical protein
MKAKIFVTSSGYDPDKGKHVKDPYLGPRPTLGACRPDIRKQLQKGDEIYVVSGKIATASQYVIGGFAIEEKISAIEAYLRFPKHRLIRGDDGQISGNVIVDSSGKQHELDHHKNFDRRIENYVIGTNPIVLLTPAEIAEGRRLTLEILQDVFQKKGDSVRKIIGRCSNLTEKQAEKLRSHLNEVKKAARQSRQVGAVCKTSEVAILV